MRARNGSPSASARESKERPRSTAIASSSTVSRDHDARADPHPMSADLAIVLALLAAAIVMFAIGRPRMDAVALLMLTALPLTGVLSMDEALAGFADGNIVLIATLFVIGEGLVRTGVARRMGDLLIARAGNSDRRLVILLMLF